MNILFFPNGMMVVPMCKSSITAEQAVVHTAAVLYFFMCGMELVRLDCKREDNDGLLSMMVIRVFRP